MRLIGEGGLCRGFICFFFSREIMGASQQRVKLKRNPFFKKMNRNNDFTRISE